MGSLRSCAQLRREHELIATLIGELDALTERRRSGAAVPFPPVASAIDFFAAFVVRCHDAKEAEALFPILAAYGGGEGALVGQLRAEHEESERLVGTLRALAPGPGVEGRAWTLLETYLQLLRQHIASEECDLLPRLEGLLSPEDDATVELGFRRIETRALGCGGDAALVALTQAAADAARRLAAALPHAPAELTARSVMRPKPGTVGPDDSLAHAAELMASLRTRELAVVSGRMLVGILVRADLEPYRGHYEWTLVRAAMTVSPVCVAPDTPVPAVARLLTLREFNAVPVTVGGELVGMVGRADILRVLALGA